MAVDKSLPLLWLQKPIKKRLYHVIYGDICAAVYSFNCDQGIKTSIKKINKSDDLKWWAEQCTKSIMEEYEFTIK